MIVVILVNYNGYTDTIEAVESLKNQNYEKNYKIIIVDNCSPDNSYEVLEKEYKNDNFVDVIKSDKNGGFSYGNNFGIKYAIKRYSQLKYFLLINNDTKSDKNMLKEFELYYEKNHKKENIGILTGKIYYYEPKNTIWYAGGNLKKKRGGALHIGAEEKDIKQYDQIKSIDFATGCLMFFSKKLIEEIGLLPEEYFMYFEDVDFSWKVIKNNKKIIYLPQIKIWHKIGRSSDLLKNIENYELFNKNRSILAKKYLSSREYFGFKIFMYFRSTIKIAEHIFKDKKL
ncbi:MAG: glycosyltransferase family 2 protein, partial [Cetobacterium sp.]